MFKKLECVCIYTADLAIAADFYKSLGLEEAWTIHRESEDGTSSMLIGLRFPDAKSSELVLSNNAKTKFTEVEILVDDVRQSYETLRSRSDVSWVRTPFATESGHVAVMEAPDGNVFVLVGR